MQKNKGLIIGIGVVGLIIASLVITSLLREDVTYNNPAQEQAGANFYYINVDQLKALYDADTEALIYIGTPKCPFCVEMEPMVREVADQLGVATYYLNTANFADGDYEKLMQIDRFFREEQWGTPLFVVVGNGRMLDDIQAGMTDRDGYLTFLERVGRL